MSPPLSTAIMRMRESENVSDLTLEELVESLSSGEVGPVLYTVDCMIAAGNGGAPRAAVAKVDDTLLPFHNVQNYGLCKRLDCMYWPCYGVARVQADGTKTRGGRA